MRGTHSHQKHTAEQGLRANSDVGIHYRLDSFIVTKL
jgi:hypothetical protein